MPETLIIFDGINDHDVAKELLHLDPYIDSLSIDEILEVDKHTQAYANLIRKNNTMYSNRVDLGASLIGRLVRDIGCLKLIREINQHELI